ncbi:MAG TPA: hypothetical protein VL337_01985 [Acidimicrobiales bacterium]|jgi:hypothetical protein|nr:hypothetical protein [Acidimicrobiales bacterium]
MSAAMSEEPGGPAEVEVEVSLADRREIVRRANLLCRRSEPHAHEIPCPGHLQEAQRQLFGQPA